jgi:DNA polymerase elongation subunit (family B)
MIIDYKQKRDGVEVSYVTKNQSIDTEIIQLKDGYYNYIACDEFDKYKISNLISFYGSAIKKDPSKYFVHHNINNFFNVDIPREFPEFQKLIDNVSIPKPFSCDIETDIDPVKGYAEQTDPFNPIRSISITDINMSTVLFIVRNSNHPKFNDLDLGYIENIVNNALTEKWVNKYQYKFYIRIFDTEAELLTSFLQNINKYFSLLIGWNFFDFDMQYIIGRCEILNIDLKKASPSHSLTQKSIEISSKQTLQLKLPSHRVIADYMLLFKESLTYNNLGSYSLDSCSELVLGLHKVTYAGNLLKLYNDDYLKFCAYALIDTILVMLIHKVTNLLTVDFFQSYYTKVPYMKLSQNSISEALIYQENIINNVFLLETEKSQNTFRAYEGGYVKTPTQKIARSVFGVDFSSLYPSAINTIGISPEVKIDTIRINSNGRPLDLIEEQKWLKYKSMGCILSPKGRIYQTQNVNPLYPRIEKKLLKERKIFRGYMDDIYLNLIPKIENEIKNRNI